MPAIPPYFDGVRFASKYGLTSSQFRVEDGLLICPSLPSLTDADLLDCVITPEELAAAERIAARAEAAEPYARTIPNGWRTWTPEQWTTYYNANISAAEIDKITNLAQAKDMLKKMSTIIDRMAKMEIALRDKTFPALPED